LIGDLDAGGLEVLGEGFVALLQLLALGAVLAVPLAMIIAIILKRLLKTGTYSD
jgi:hypothetical protein